jgi:signal transduction histidine kinase
MQDRMNGSLWFKLQHRGALGVMAGTVFLFGSLGAAFAFWCHRLDIAPHYVIPCVAAWAIALVVLVTSLWLSSRAVLTASRASAQAQQAGERAATREGSFHSVVDRSSDGVVVVDGEGIVRFANRAACALLGREQTGLEDRPAPFPHAGWDPLEIEVAGPTSPRIVELRKTDTDWEGLPARLVLLRDITERTRTALERERLIGELQTKNEELERFTYTVSHDLRAPLITIKGYLGFLERAAASGDGERLRGDIRRIDTAAERMQRLLDELLHLCRIGREAGPATRVEFAPVVEEAAELVRGRLAAERVRLVVRDGLPAVQGDRSRLVEAVQNLLDNAAKFMGDQRDPTIEVGARGSDEQGRHVLYVRDNGMGIPEEQRERVFGLFNKLSADTDGTGVGLTLVRRIVEVHGGTIHVESPGGGGGRGATFVFTLPPG